MSRAQVRSRLQQAGYDPGLADQYFDSMEGTGDPVSEVDPGFLEAMGALGILQAGVDFPLDSITLDSLRLAADTLAALPDSVLSVFGLDVFQRRTTGLDQVLNGPVGDDYQLGPGDQLILVLTGDVELAYASLDVTREGFVIIPDVGQVFVNGQTLGQLRGSLFRRLSEVYSGIRDGGDATTFFDVSLGRLRASQVSVIGDVQSPGSYIVSSVSTVFAALQVAGGPTELGSFRRVVVRRGGQEVRQVDLYDYLLRGDASDDIRLEHGDIVFVPPAGSHITVRGEFRRPALYEVLEGEGLRDVIGFAGGMLPTAHARALRIERLLPFAERSPGMDRVLMTVDAGPLIDDPTNNQDVALLPGDDIFVPATIEEQRNRVAVAGAVHFPGRYQLVEGLTARGLLEQAELRDDAYLSAVQVYRPRLDSAGVTLLRIAIDPALGGIQDLPLLDRDSVVVFSVDSLMVSDSIRIAGFVRNPGRYAYARGMTAEDLILVAGGLVEGALTTEAEISRTRVTHDRTDTLAVSIPIRLSGIIPSPEILDRGSTGAGPSLSAADVPLEVGDRLFVRERPGYDVPITVFVSGEVGFPGAYAVEQRNERLSDIVRRAGGFSPEAYVPGARLLRDSLVVGIDLAQAIERPGGPDDLVLRAGDQILIPEFDPTVSIRGSVTFETRAVFESGMGVSEYIRQAGGSLDDADLNKISVEYANGRRETTKKFLWLIRQHPRVEPGSTILVPARPPSQGDDGLGELLNRTVSLATTVLTLLVLSDQIRN
ncbi:MAG: SLBB domain-containing protein [Gemmatimonadota bacterium]|nr:SLBB domain-containing protein [Gemmatimonadota bacterium]